MQTPFSFGDKDYPGLAKIAEEAGEFGQVFGKLVMTGGHADYFDGTDLRKALLEELADLDAALAFFKAEVPLLAPERRFLDDRVKRKLHNFYAYRQEATENTK
jgi:hypothetical protein